MNLIDESQQSRDQKKSADLQKMLFVIVVIVAILIVLAIVVYLKIQDAQNSIFKFLVNEKSAAYTEELFKKDKATGKLFEDNNGKIYFSIKDFAHIVDYSEQNGTPNAYVEKDYSHCYVSNSFETTVFSAGSSVITKTEMRNNNNEVEIDTKDVVIQDNNILYASQDTISKAFNCVINYDKVNNSVSVYTLDVVVQRNIDAYPLTTVQLSTETYENIQNQKALLEGYVIIKDPTTSLQGVLDTKKPDAAQLFYGQTVIPDSSKLLLGTRYSSILYLENTGDFSVKTSNNKVGIMSKNATYIVEPIYDAIEKLAVNKNLYVVRLNNLFGIVDTDGRTILNIQYQEIGISDLMGDPNVSNRFLFYDHYIPVKSDNVYSFYDTSGNRLLAGETFSGIGCVYTRDSNEQAETTSRSVILVPDLHAIVVSKQITFLENNKRVTKTLYGLVGDTSVSYNGSVDEMNSITDISIEKIYARIDNGQTSYYLRVNGTSNELVGYINSYLNKQNTQTETQMPTTTDSEMTNPEMVNPVTTSN